MAQECASVLKIGSWEVVPWDPESLTMDLLEIFAASDECSTLEGAAEVAWILGANDVILKKVTRLVGECNFVKFDSVFEDKKNSLST